MAYSGDESSRPEDNTEPKRFEQKNWVVRYFRVCSDISHENSFIIFGVFFSLRCRWALQWCIEVTFVKHDGIQLWIGEAFWMFVLLLLHFTWTFLPHFIECRSSPVSTAFFHSIGCHWSNSLIELSPTSRCAKGFMPKSRCPYGSTRPRITWPAYTRNSGLIRGQNGPPYTQQQINIPLKLGKIDTNTNSVWTDKTCKFRMHTKMVIKTSTKNRSTVFFSVCLLLSLFIHDPSALKCVVCQYQLSNPSHCLPLSTSHPPHHLPHMQICE